jgi:hypothetical protein
VITNSCSNHRPQGVNVAQSLRALRQSQGCRPALSCALCPRPPSPQTLQSQCTLQGPGQQCQLGQEAILQRPWSSRRLLVTQAQLPVL